MEGAGVEGAEGGFGEVCEVSGFCWLVFGVMGRADFLCVRGRLVQDASHGCITDG